MANEIPDRVHIVEVGPRDGLQNEPDRIDTARKPPHGAPQEIRIFLVVLRPGVAQQDFDWPVRGGHTDRLQRGAKVVKCHGKAVLRFEAGRLYRI